MFFFCETVPRFKVMRCVHENEGDVVVKLFIHRRGETKGPTHGKSSKNGGGRLETILKLR